MQNKMPFNGDDDTLILFDLTTDHPVRNLNPGQSIR